MFLTGVAWTLQVVQLPLFLKAGQPGYVRQHRRRNTMLMTAPMLVELATAVWLWRIGPLLLVAAIWVVTLVWYMPAYSVLAKGYNEATIRRLMAWNWVRTLCWTARSIIMLWIASGR